VSLPFPNVPSLPGVPQVPRSAAFTPTEVTTLGVDAISSKLWEASQAPAQWGIFTTDLSRQIVTPDSVVDFNVRPQWEVSTFPVQDGTFASYNKVKVPAEYVVRMTKGGGPQSAQASPLSLLLGAAVSRSQPLSQAQADYYALSNSALLQGLLSQSNGGLNARQGFLSQISALAGSIQLVTIVTPESIYPSVNVTRYELTRRGAEGAFFLDVDVYFIQVLTVSATYISTGSLVPQNKNGTSNAKDATAQPPSNAGTVQPAPIGTVTIGPISITQ
jgi:hypothetical protein